MPNMIFDVGEDNHPPNIQSVDDQIVRRKTFVNDDSRCQRRQQNHELEESASRGVIINFEIPSIKLKQQLVNVLNETL